jgi:uncharacterized protein YxjI
MKDILGRTIKVGDTVLTKDNGSQYMSLVTQILSVKPNYVIVEVNSVSWITRAHGINTKKKMKRTTPNVLVINDQLRANELEASYGPDAVS